MEEQKHIITIGYARQALIAGSREQERMLRYAEFLTSLDVIVFTHKRDGLESVVSNKNLTVHATNSVTRLGMLFDAYKIGRHILKKYQKKDCVVSSQDPFETSLVGRLLTFSTGVYHHVQLHGDNFSDTTWFRESILNRVRMWFGLYILKSSKSIRVVSERIKRSLIEKGINEARITVLPIRPELETFLNTPHTVGDHNPFVFLIASRFAPEKNIPLMLRAFAQISKLHPDVRLRIVGKGSEEQKIRSLIIELGITPRVIMVPWTESVENEMQNADVFLSASDHEAYGLTLLEAMAVGLPLITTDVGCVGEVVKDGVHGIVVPIRDEKSFVGAMERMITNKDLREACARAGREVARVIATTPNEEYAQEWVASLSSVIEAV